MPNNARGLECKVLPALHEAQSPNTNGRDTMRWGGIQILNSILYFGRMANEYNMDRMI